MFKEIGVSTVYTHAADWASAEATPYLRKICSGFCMASSCFIPLACVCVCVKCSAPLTQVGPSRPSSGGQDVLLGVGAAFRQFRHIAGPPTG